MGKGKNKTLNGQIKMDFGMNSRRKDETVLEHNEHKPYSRKESARGKILKALLAKYPTPKDKFFYDKILQDLRKYIFKANNKNDFEEHLENTFYHFIRGKVEFNKELEDLLGIDKEDFNDYVESLRLLRDLRNWKTTGKPAYKLKEYEGRLPDLTLTDIKRLRAQIETSYLRLNKHMYEMHDFVMRDKLQEKEYLLKWLVYANIHWQPKSSSQFDLHTLAGNILKVLILTNHHLLNKKLNKEA